jgi:hypothetical protein
LPCSPFCVINDQLVDHTHDVSIKGIWYSLMLLLRTDTMLVAMVRKRGDTHAFTMFDADLLEDSTEVTSCPPTTDEEFMKWCENTTRVNDLEDLTSNSSNSNNKRTPHSDSNDNGGNNNNRYKKKTKLRVADNKPKGWKRAKVVGAPTGNRIPVPEFPPPPPYYGNYSCSCCCGCYCCFLLYSFFFFLFAIKFQKRLIPSWIY